MKAALATWIFLLALVSCALARAADVPAMATPAAAGLGIPDSVESRIGSLQFFHGFPDSATIQAAYDYLDFIRGVRVFIEAMPAISRMQLRNTLRAVGAGNGVVAIREEDGEGLRALGWLDLRKGPLVVQAAPGVAVALSDAWGRSLDGMDGFQSTEAARKVLVCPPGFAGKVPATYSKVMSRTFGVAIELQVPGGDQGEAPRAALRTKARIYALAQAAQPPRLRAVNFPGKQAQSTALPPLNAFEMVDRIVQEEPAQALDPGMARLLEAIGIRKGRPFRPEGRAKPALEDAARVGNATLRSLRAELAESGDGDFVQDATGWPLPDMPDRVESRIGTLAFEAGEPTPETVALVRNHLDFMQGVEAYLGILGGAASEAWRNAFVELGIGDDALGIFEGGMDARSLVLTGDTQAVYLVDYVDLAAGPMVVESPPGMQGEVRDAWMQPIAALGVTGADKGKGGRYLLLPPDHSGEVPKGFRVLRSPTFGAMVWWRGLRLRGDPEPAIDNARRNARIYRMGQARPIEGEFVGLTGREFNALPETDASVYAQVAALLEREPAESLDAPTRAALAGIGIRKDQAFAPDERMQSILEEAAVVGDAIARTIVYASRFPGIFPWPRSQWQATDPAAAASGAPAADLRIRAAYYLGGFAKAMAVRGEAAGMQSAVVFRDAMGEGLDGGRTYRIRLPAKVPATRGWSLVVYDNQTRSMLQTDQRFPGIGDRQPGLRRNKDGSVDIWVGPQAPAGKEANWVQTLPERGWSLVLRLYGPTEPWYAKTWRPGEIEPQK